MTRQPWVSGGLAHRAGRGATASGVGARTVRALAALGLLALALVALAACGAAEDLLADGRDAEVVTEPAPDVAEEAPAEDVAIDAGTVDLGDLDDADRARRIVRQGSLTVRYSGDFDAAYDAVASLATDLGGVVVEVDATTREGLTRGVVTVEVPVDRFDELIEEATDLGEVVRRQIDTQDVTEAYVDLESRLRHLDRQEAFYLDLFDEAETVEDALAVASYLEDVQERREQVQGRLEALERRSASSTLRVELVDERADLDEPVPAGLPGYWEQALEAFVAVAGMLLVVTVGGAPLLLAAVVVVLVALLLVRLARNRRRSTGPAEEPHVPAADRDYAGGND